MDEEISDLLEFLDAQRHAVLEVVDGLDERGMRRALLPSGWTPVGMVAHLCDAERYWFQWVLTGHMHAAPIWPEGPDAEARDAFDTHLPVAVVLDFYRAQTAIFNELLAQTVPGAVPAGIPLPSHASIATSVRRVAIHLLEETARHAGHLDAARELADGTTGRGAR